MTCVPENNKARKDRELSGRRAGLWENEIFGHVSEDD